MTHLIPQNAKTLLGGNLTGFVNLSTGRRVHGGRVYWMESEIDEWLANLPTKAQAA